MNDRRQPVHQELVRLPDGRLVDRAAERDWLRGMKGLERRKVRRLSELLPKVER